MNKEITINYSLEDLIKRLGLPEEATIIQISSMVFNNEPRKYQVRVSAPEETIREWQKSQKG